MPTESVNRSVEVLGRATRPKSFATLSTASLIPVTNSTSKRCRCVSVPSGIGSPPRSSRTSCSWPAKSSCRNSISARPSTALLSTRISA